MNSNSERIIVNDRPFEKFDLITCLKNYPHILEKIFSYLKPKELRTISCVCWSWQQILIHRTPKANRRRSNSIRKLRIIKQIKGEENWPIDVKCAKFKRKLCSQRKTLSSIQNLSVKNQFDQYSSFHDDTETINDENDQNSQNLSAIKQKSKTKRKRWRLAQVPFKSW